MSQDTAGQEPVKKPEEGVSPEAVENKQPIAAEVDPELEMARLLAENKRLAEERENYRKGMLKAKGKIIGDVETPESDADDRMRQLVREELAQTNYAKAQQALEETAIKLAKQNKELKQALQNRQQVSGGNQAPSHEVPQVRDTSISPEKEQALLASFKGTDEDKKRKLAQWKANRFGKK